jgi:hypothetical protein
VGKKAAPDPTSDKQQRHLVQVAAAEALPLDDSNWLPIEEVHRRLYPQLGNHQLIDRDLTTVFVSGWVRTLRRWLKRPTKARINDHRLWAVRFELDSWSDGLHIAYRLHGERRYRPHQVQFLRYYSFYAWQPDLAEVWPTVFAPAPEPQIKVQLTDKVKVQLVEKPAPRRAKAQLPSQPAEDQIQALMSDVSELSDIQKKIRRCAVLKYGARWRDIDPAEVKGGADDDELYKKEVGLVGYHITTFRRALGRKK